MGVTAAVCAANGHLVSFRVFDAARGLEFLENGNASRVRPFCEYCGSPVITVCPGCSLAIPPPRGFEGFRPFCGGCGQPFGWATRTQRLENLYVKLAYEPGMTDSDRLQLRDAIEVLTQADQLDEGKPDKRLLAALRVVKSSAGALYEAVVVPVLAETLSRMAKSAAGIP
jgi:hypothetical protein